MLTAIHHTIQAMATATNTPQLTDILPWPHNESLTTKVADSLPWSHDDSLATKDADTQFPLPTSTNPTAPANIQLAPHLHQRHMRNNVPTNNTPTSTPTTPPLLHTQPTILTPPTMAPTLQTTETTPPRRSERIALLTPRRYSNLALAMATHTIPTHMPHCCAIIHPITGESITKYKTLLKEPLLRDTWARAFGKEFGNLAQGDAATNTPGTDNK